MEEDGDFDDDDGMSQDVSEKRGSGEKEKKQMCESFFSRRTFIWRAMCVLNEHLSRKGNRLLVSTVNLGRLQLAVSMHSMHKKLLERATRQNLRCRSILEERSESVPVRRRDRQTDKH